MPVLRADAALGNPSRKLSNEINSLREWFLRRVDPK